MGDDISHGGTVYKYFFKNLLLKQIPVTSNTNFLRIISRERSDGEIEFLTATKITRFKTPAEKLT